MVLRPGEASVLRRLIVTSVIHLSALAVAYMRAGDSISYQSWPSSSCSLWSGSANGLIGSLS